MDTAAASDLNGSVLGCVASASASASPVDERLLPDWQPLPAPMDGLAMCVVVPVRDEARRLSATLRALAAQRESDGAPLQPGLFEVIVLANNCQDRSAQVARRFAHRHPALNLHVVEVQFPVAVAHVGHARACLMNEASRRLRQVAGGSGVIASTDGDTRVDCHWVAEILAEFSLRQVAAVGGRILSRAQAGDSLALRALVRRDDLYRRWRVRLESLLDPIDADPWPRHHQHFGASLAVRVDAYDAVGGCPPVPWLEDEALVMALRGHDLPLRHSLQVRVLTSGRRLGRVQIGLSQQLRAWAAMAEAGEEPRVPDPAYEAVVWRARAALRTAWAARSARSNALRPDDSPALAALAHCHALAFADVAAAWEKAPVFGAFCIEVESLAAAHGPPPLVGQRQALRVLRRLVGAQGA